MSTQHTPGPWSAGVSMWKGQEVFTAVETANPKKITAVCGVAGAPDEQESIANATLIAAAPELLEALRGMIDAHAIPSTVCKDRPAYEAARAAIAKATGPQDVFQMQTPI